MPNITDAKILIMATDGFEQSELVEPLTQLKEKGATVHVASLDGKSIKGWDGDDWGDTVDVDLKISDVDIGLYTALVLPGGQINPDVLRADDAAVAIVSNFVADKKIVAAICHAPWLLIEAEVVDGREMASYKSIRTDLRNAGANVVDKAVAISDRIITSRTPEDLHAFISKIVEEVEQGKHARDVAA